MNLGYFIITEAPCKCIQAFFFAQTQVHSAFQYCNKILLGRRKTNAWSQIDEIFIFRASFLHSTSMPRPSTRTHLTMRS